MAEAAQRAGAEAGLLGELGAGQLLRAVPVLAVAPGALRELPGPAAQRVAELLDQPEAVVLGGDDQREVGALDDAVEAGGAVVALDHVLAHPDPGVLVGQPAARRPHRPSLADRCHDGAR